VGGHRGAEAERRDLVGLLAGRRGEQLVIGWPVSGGLVEPGDDGLERRDALAPRGQGGANSGGEDRLPDAGVSAGDEQAPQESYAASAMRS
jgi:hypothetical protein